MAIGETLYPTNVTGDMDITFHLTAERFASDCDYDLSKAIVRMPSYFIRKGEGMAYYARHFYTIVRNLCLTNGGAVNTIEA